MDNDQNKVKYHLSALPRGSFQDWLMIIPYGFGEKKIIDGRKFTLRTSGALKLAPTVREQKIYELVQTVRATNYKGHSIDEGYFSQEDTENHLFRGE